MLSLKKCKELKEVGFPQGMEIGENFWQSTEGQMYNCQVFHLFSGPSHDDGDIYFRVPSLSELIGACGDDFLRLCHAPKTEHDYNKWGSFSWKEEKISNGVCNVNGRGAEPAEAVANLWLALNKK